MDIKYQDAKHLIKEADVLLFKAGKFPGVGWWISKYTHSPYSHVGLAHINLQNTIECLEFREFCGSRRYPLAQYVEKGAQIDVFRVATTTIFPSIIQINNEYYQDFIEYHFTDEIAHKITNTGLDLLGKPYSYWTIWQIFKTYIPFARLRTKVIKNGEPDPKQFVCSTLVTYTYRINFIDPVPFLSDRYTTPGDIARSSLFHKLFTIIR